MAVEGGTGSRGASIPIGLAAFVTYVGVVSQQWDRRAAFGAAVVGVLLAITASVGLALSPATPTASGVTTTGSTHASVGLAASQVEPAVLGVSHPASTRAAGIDRPSGGPGYAVAVIGLLVLALLALAVAVSTAWRRPTSLSGSASGPRAPPTPAFC